MTVERHIIEVAGMRVAVLVCHDLAAWSPRGISVAKGFRIEVGRAFNAAVIAAELTLVLHLPHTVDKANTWRAAWGRLEKTAGGNLVSGTSAIRYRTMDRRTPKKRLEARLLAQTGRGERVLDIVVHDAGRWPGSPDEQRA